MAPARGGRVHPHGGAAHRLLQPPALLRAGSARGLREVATSGDATAAASGDRLTVVTYNIRAGIGPGEFPAAWWRTVDDGRLAGMADILRGLGADVVALQEVALTTIDGVVRDQTAELAGMLGFASRYGAVGHFPIVDPASGDLIGACFWGNSVLSRYPIGASRAVGLPIASDDDLVEPLETALELAGVRYAAAPVGVRERRCLLVTRIEAPGGPVHVLATHLTHIGTAQRELQAGRIADEVARLEPPVVVCGDLNAPIEAADMGRLRSLLADAFEAVGVPPADARRESCSTHRIDHVLTRGLTVRSCRVVREAGDLSDHWPVAVELTA